MINKELQKQEAIERMKMLDIYGQAIEEFKDRDVINKSEFNGILYWLTDKEKQTVKEFEDEFGGIVYHVIRNNTEFGELYSLLYVSQDDEEWEDDRNDLKNNCTLVYVKNMDDDFSSEFGSIGIRPRFGGVIRVS